MTRTWLSALLLAAALGGCGANEPAAVAAAPVAVAAQQRSGEWLGGPEPLSGKLPTGIISWWQFQPRQPRAGEAFDLTLRLEGVKQTGASVSLRAGDGARLQDGAHTAWPLKAGETAEIKVRVVAPAGDSFIHVETRQGERASTRSILLALPGSNPDQSAQQRKDYATDARGEPIVRMQSGSK